MEGWSTKRISSREMRRLQSRLLGNIGMDMQELGTAEEVTIRFVDRQISIKSPSVVSMKIEKESIFQVVGGDVSESTEEAEKPEAAEMKITEEDILLVSQQAEVSQEEARRALIESGGDLAKAILTLSARRKPSR